MCLLSLNFDFCRAVGSVKFVGCTWFCRVNWVLLGLFGLCWVSLFVGFAGYVQFVESVSLLCQVCFLSQLGIVLKGALMRLYDTSIMHQSMVSPRDGERVSAQSTRFNIFDTIFPMWLSLLIGCPDIIDWCI